MALKLQLARNPSHQQDERFCCLSLTFSTFAPSRSAVISLINSYFVLRVPIRIVQLICVESTLRVTEKTLRVTKKIGNGKEVVIIALSWFHHWIEVCFLID
jgi:hypothetical protein